MAKRKGGKGKGKGFSFGGGGGGGGGLPGGMKGGLAGQLQAMQQQMMETQETLGDETVEVTAGGGVIKIVMTGHQKLESITIDPEVVDPEDVEMLQDLIMAAVNEAVEKSQGLASEKMEGITGDLNIPGLSGLL
ncbi:YbaB/EbfC family nucleoid-associated protein [Anaerolineales bacterium HSG25]|nr:YbaB/EbfC family nucleoid-associated protein [Anaerolineales bacterium HSG25]